jgi:hypothetical protein
MCFGPAFLFLMALTSVPVPTRTPSLNLEDDVLPVLTRAGCNAGACHGKARGQNGFHLALFAYDPDFDYAALTQEGRGRRVFPAAPEHSLLLRKATARVAHGGGKRLRPGDGLYEILLHWIQQGMPRRPAGAPVPACLTLEPSTLTLSSHAEKPLRVTAQYSDGRRRDVTRLAVFQSNEGAVAAVSATGVVKAGSLPGETAIMARFLDQFAVAPVVIPFPGPVDPAAYAVLPHDHFIDRLVWDRLQQLGLVPSAPAGNATFLRRASLDVIGRLPTPDETRAFLADRRPDKRARLIDRLLERPEYADFWANKWADLLRPNLYRVGIKAAYNLDAWLRKVFRENWPYDRFVRELLTARGSSFHNGAVVVFRDRREPDEIAPLVSQLFLGVRLECARCHHHPFEVYGQDEFYSFAAYFARLGRKGTGLSPPISGGEETVFVARQATPVRHPLTGKEMSPRPLSGKARASGDGDPRQGLADWLTAPDNPYFARAAVNRVWAEVMGRGLVEPVDDLRATNPPSNAPLLEALADDFRHQGYDLKKLRRTILTSHVYALSSVPNSGNVADLRNYSRHYRQRLRAEVLLDAVCDVTGVPETFAAAPMGTRAVALWTVRTPSVFLDSFGRPDPNQDPPCERAADSTVVQALHLMNAPALQRKVTSDTGRAAALAASVRTPAEIVDELYLRAYCRFPTAEERADCVGLFSRPGITRRQATEDLLWALLNTPEFTFKD